MMARLGKVGKSGGTIASYEHLSLSGEVREPFAASKSYSTWGASVTVPLRRGQNVRCTHARLRLRSILMVTICSRMPCGHTIATTHI
jgi:hypothetical protein